MPLGTALTCEDIAGSRFLTAEQLDSEASAGRVAAVAR